MFMKCFVTRINNRKLADPIEFEIERTYPNSDGASIFDQQRKIPDYDFQRSYVISCGDINYDIDVMGWTVLSDRHDDVLEEIPTTDHLASLAYSDEEASHRIVGTSEKFGTGIIGYYKRDQLDGVLAHIRTNDPTAQVRVEPHNPILNGKALRSTDVEWIVNSDGDLGVKIGDQFFFLYKGESFMYGENRHPTQHSDKYRIVDKREFGELGPKSPNLNFREIGNWLRMDHSSTNNEVAYFE
jgi:hypothetical protein